MPGLNVASSASSVAPESFRSAALAFSSSHLRLLVPASGTSGGLRDSSQAMASCAGEQPSLAASCFSESTSFLIVLRIVALEARHVAAAVVLRQGVAGRDGGGEEAAAERRVGEEADAEFVADGRTSLSTSRVHSEYSVCSAAIGCTLWARRMVFGAGFGNSQMPDLALLP